MARHKEPRKRLATLAALTAAFAMLLSALGIMSAPAFAEGNQGTIKVHALGSEPGTESNEPKVCAFNLEFYGFVEGFDGYVKFEVQGGDGPTGVGTGPFAVGTANADGYFVSQYFNVAGGPTVQNGHYKVTLYGKFNDGRLNMDDVKAKSKVFKVDCPPPPTPPTPVSPTEPTRSDVCEPATGLTNDRINNLSDANFTYVVDGKDPMGSSYVAVGISHTVNAIAKPGVVVTEGAKTEWTFTFTKVVCTTTTPPPPPPPVVIPPVVTPPVKDYPAASVKAWCVTPQWGEGWARLNNKRSTVSNKFRIVRSGPDRVVTLGAGKARTIELTGLRVGSRLKVTSGSMLLAKTRVPGGCHQPTPPPDTGFRVAPSST